VTDRPEYTEIEHTADVGFTLRAPDLRAAFERTAAAAFDVMCDLDRVAPDASFDVRVEARPGDLEQLMVRWLSELLYLSSSEQVLLCGFDVVELGSDGSHAGVARSPDQSGASLVLVARVRGERFDDGRHHLKTELKAPTYHELVVERDGETWSVRIIFDT